MNGFKWELYDTNKDWSEAHDLAATMPDKLRDMQQLFTMEAAKYHVFPLDDSRLGRFISEKPSYSPGRTEFTYSGTVMNVPFPDTGTAPSLLNKSYTITAEIEVPEGGGEGMLMTDGGRFAGYGFYLLKGVPVFTWDLLDLERVKWKGKAAAEARQAGSPRRPVGRPPRHPPGDCHGRRLINSRRGDRAMGEMRPATRVSGSPADQGATASIAGTPAGTS